MARAASALLLAMSATSLGAQAPVTAKAPVAANPAYAAHRVAKGKSFTDFETMLRDVMRADVIHLGEQHDDAGTHALQLAVLEGFARRGVPVVLSLEMFERDVQTSLDAYLAGTMPESAFLAGSRPWNNYASDYRPLVEFAKAKGWPVVASNIPRPLASAVSRNGLAVFDTLSSTQRPWVAADNQCGTDTKYARKFINLMGDMAGHGSNAMPAAAMDRFYAAQCVKDEVMAESIARALDAHPNAVIVHAAGSFHVEEGLGTVERVTRRVKAGSVQRRDVQQHVITFVPTADLDAIDAKKQRHLGTYVVHVYRPAVANAAR
jgi:uncharacterized iron-regulated protein